MELTTTPRYRVHLKTIVPHIRWLITGSVLVATSLLIWCSFAPDITETLVSYYTYEQSCCTLRMPPQPNFSPLLREQKWIEYADNPVLPDSDHSEDTGTVFDLVLIRENMTSTGVPADIYYRQKDYEPVETVMTWRMWNSWRPSKGIAYSTSVDGRKWEQTLQMSLNNNNSGWGEADVNRPFVKKMGTGKYGMWYTGQDIPQGIVGGSIGYAESTDGITFERIRGKNISTTYPKNPSLVLTFWIQ